ncbi:MAG TPA: hypothetical protein VIR57_08010 [Chloroflexota bacterium]|jgi:hypothetical protein
MSAPGTPLGAIRERERCAGNGWHGHYLCARPRRPLSVRFRGWLLRPTTSRWLAPLLGIVVGCGTFLAVWLVGR